jgi:hypothetical protein
MKIAILLLILAISSSCTPSKTVEADTTPGNINSEAPYLWPSTAFPRPLLISDQFSPAEESNIIAMSSAWETAIEDKKNLISHGTEYADEVDTANLDLDALGRDGVNGIYKITHWPLSLPGSALAVTQIWGTRHNAGRSNEHVIISHADILLNEHIYNFRTDDTFVSTTFDLRTVLLHEMGHYLGLGHKEVNSVMLSSIGHTTKNLAPTNVDKADMASKYSISLSGGSGHAVTSGRNVIYTPDPGDVGKNIRILIELMADGECVHKEDGAVVARHPSNIK